MENQGRLSLEEQKLDLESSLDEVVRNIDEALASEQENVKQEPEAERRTDEERVESVRILGPGSYELNLDTLFERKELVMAIREEGSYALHLPSVFNQKKERAKPKKHGADRIGRHGNVSGQIGWTQPCGHFSGENFRIKITARPCFFAKMPNNKKSSC